MVMVLLEKKNVCSLSTLFSALHQAGVPVCFAHFFFCTFNSLNVDVIHLFHFFFRKSLLLIPPTRMLYSVPVQPKFSKKSTAIFSPSYLFSLSTLFLTKDSPLLQHNGPTK